MSSTAVLSGLTAQIADDLSRPDLTTQISTAIVTAIEHYQSTRFYFTEKRNSTFSTVVSQAVYTSTDNADIPNWFEFDDVFVTVSGWKRPLVRSDADELDGLIGSAAANGEPIEWAWIDQSLLLYPIPNAVRTITVNGAIKKAAPTDDTAGNVWMTEAFELIRCHAKGLLYSHVIKDGDEASTCFQLAEMAKGRLERETTGKRATGTIRSTSF